MPLQEKLVTIEELAKALGRSEDYLRRHWLRLHRQEGMPRKLPTAWTWPRRAIEDWIDSYGDAASLAPAGGEVSIVAIDRVASNENQRLRNRYLGRA